MRKVWPSAVMVGMVVFCAVGSAGAWEPVPRLAGHQTTVTRIVEVGHWGNFSLAALAESTGPACAAVGARHYPPAGVFSDAWIALVTYGDGSAAAHMLAVALTARAQNLLVRVTIATGDQGCHVVGLQTCVDAAACVLPAAP